MASNINANNINGAYPVAGQDNDSQGFRDNFTNIKTNFSYAATEITELQSKGIFKQALTGQTLNNDMGGNELKNAVLIDMAENVIPKGTTSGTVTLDYAQGSYFTVSTAGSITLSFVNWPMTGKLGSVRLQVFVSNISYYVELPSSVNIGTSNIQGLNPSNNRITFNRTGYYEFLFESSDSGSNITIIDCNRNLDPIYLPSSEDLADGAAASLAVTTSYFTTDAVETATLAAGYAGQVKVLAMYGDSGDMEITVSNAGWKSSGSGTVTFSAIGQACTLMYINSKWFCVGNNGATFA